MTATRAYCWQGLRFDVPDGVEDDTVVTFREQGARPGFNLTVARAPLPSSLEGWASQQEEALRARRPPGYAAEPHRRIDVAGTPGVLCERRFHDERGGRFVQRQVFVGVGSDVAMITATADERAAPRAWNALQALLYRFRVASDAEGAGDGQGARRRDDAEGPR